MSISFTITVQLRGDDFEIKNDRTKHDTKDPDRNEHEPEPVLLDDAYVCYAKLLRLSQEKTEFSHPRYAGIFVPSTLVDAALNQLLIDHCTTCNDNNPSSTCFIPIPPSYLHKLSRSLLSMIHPFLERNFCLHSVISIRNEQHAPSDMVLLDLSHAPPAAVADLLETTNCEMIHAGDYSALKVILVSQVNFTSKNQERNLRSYSDSITDVASASLMTLPPPPPTPSTFDLPTCPVCLHRVDPLRLGLPKPPIHQLCSKFCPPPDHHHLLMVEQSSSPSSKLNAASSSSSFSSICSCPRQRLLKPWPPPSRCVCCRMIQNYWTNITSQQHHAIRSACSSNDHQEEEELSQVFCYDCALQETLWVCMTCGYVGCGRYSNKHAAKHFAERGHPYSLELATLRIWDYVGGEFVHRIDLLQCPCCIVATATMASSLSSSSSPFVTMMMDSPRGYASAPVASAAIGNSMSVFPTSNTSTGVSGGGGGVQGGMRYPFATTEQQHDNNHNDMMARDDQSAIMAKLPQHPRSSSTNNGDEKSPKKATMIGEEYEALLYSALEEQAQHYEGKISRLLATLTAESVDASSITVEEQELIDTWQSEIHQMRLEMEVVSRELLEAQAQEAGHRATSSRLLREQQVAEDLLKKVQEETLREQQEGRRQVEELEQQIADLTANQRMRDQFSHDEELSNAQIFGTVASAQKPRGKNKSGKNKLPWRSRK